MVAYILGTCRSPITGLLVRASDDDSSENPANNNTYYYTTQAVSGPITKSTNQISLLGAQYILSIGLGIVPNDPAFLYLQLKTT